MPFSFILVDNCDSGGHYFRAIAPDPDPDWLRTTAAEYINLRTKCALPLSAISLDGIEVLSIESIQARLVHAAIPARINSNFDVVRSDFGEVLSYYFLEQEFGTLLGYKGVRDRETVQMPGRGIDAVGVKDNVPLTLVLCETKVSNEDASPPQVVDRGSDCLRHQHREHLRDPAATAKKIWNQSRHILDPSLRDLLFAAATLLEAQRWDRLRLVACCVLVRPRQKYTVADFGTFRQQPDDFAPTSLRFAVVCIPDEVDNIVTQWYGAVMKMQGVV